jgi:hypothetical protein
MKKVENSETEQATATRRLRRLSFLAGSFNSKLTTKHKWKGNDIRDTLKAEPAPFSDTAEWHFGCSPFVRHVFRAFSARKFEVLR